MSAIKTLSIHGFKSIQSMDKLALSNLNVLIGANGVGKSNFISFFRILSEMVNGRLKVWTSKQGGADRVLSYGVKETQTLSFSIRFDNNGFDVELEPTSDSGFTFTKEWLYFNAPNHDVAQPQLKEWLYFNAPNHDVAQPQLGVGHSESKLKSEMAGGGSEKIAKFCYSAISAWRVFHFHDTSDTAGVKRLAALHDNEYLRGDASNLAPFLFKLIEESPNVYNQIIKTIRLAVPFFDDFVLKPNTLESGEQQVRLLWQQTDSDYAMWPSQLSDGSLRFICLVTALLQPDPPSTIIIDEPELGLHPYAITLLGALLRSASTQMQVIVSTQSVALLNEFEIDNVIVVERKESKSTFARLDKDDFVSWLENYSVGELWEKNILGGRPSK